MQKKMFHHRCCCDKCDDSDMSPSDNDHYYINGCNVPSYVTYEARDAEFQEWLPERLKAKLAVIREQVTKLSQHHKQQASILKFFTPHGHEHCIAVEANIHRLIPGDKYLCLSEYERFFLLASAWLHDVGMYIEGIEKCVYNEEQLRSEHHRLSETIIVEEYTRLGVNEFEANVLGTLARFHRKKVNIEECQEVFSSNNIVIRLRLIAAYLRLADGLDIDQSRTPNSEYAVALTYDIPMGQKYHWIRSKLLLGTQVDVEKSTITVHLKYPENIEDYCKKRLIDRREIKRFTEKIDALYDEAIVSELESELNSVRNILIENRITTFITIKKVVHNVFIDERFLCQIWLAVDRNIFLHGPSSSTIYNAVLETMLEILNEHDRCKHNRLNAKENQEDKKYYEKITDTLLKFSEDMYKKVIYVRRCHFGLINVLEILKELLSKDTGAVLTTMEKIVLELETISNFKDKNNYYNIDDTIKELKRYSNSDLRCITKFIHTYIVVLLHIAKIDKRLVRDHAADLLSGEKANPYVRWVRETYIHYKICELQNKYPSKPESACDRQNEKLPCTIGTTHNTWPQKIADPIIPPKIGILLYGYSKYAIRALCGMRDGLLQDILKALICAENKSSQPSLELYKKLFSTEFSQSSFERDISNFFEIYVCECQPKNIQTWYGTTYHDGFAYIKALNKRGFHNVTLIADAIAGTLTGQYYSVPKEEADSAIQEFFKPEPSADEFHKRTQLPSETRTTRGPGGKVLTSHYYNFPRINYLIFGANGFSEKYIYHSAGHLTSICCAREKGRTDIVLAVQTSKFCPEKEVKGNLNFSNRSISLSPYIINKLDGWKTLQSYPDEHIRKIMFIPHDRKYFSLDMPGASLPPVYTPTEDRIPFDVVDYIITERECAVNFELATALCNWFKTKKTGDDELDILCQINKQDNSECGNFINKQKIYARGPKAFSDNSSFVYADGSATELLENKSCRIVFEYLGWALLPWKLSLPKTALVQPQVQSPKTTQESAGNGKTVNPETTSETPESQPLAQSSKPAEESVGGENSSTETSSSLKTSNKGAPPPRDGLPKK